MTEEQIKNLKAGDKFTIEYKVTEVKGSLVHFRDRNNNDECCLLSADDMLSLGTLITTPTFEVGDTVRIVPDPLTGTVYGGGIDMNEEQNRTGVVLSELEAGNIEVRLDGHNKSFFSVHCLELVKKAVKDKYIVEEDDLEWHVTDEDYSTCAFNKINHPSAQAAAEAEYARLKAEWRKQLEQMEQFGCIWKNVPIGVCANCAKYGPEPGCCKAHHPKIINDVVTCTNYCNDFVQKEGGQQ